MWHLLASSFLLLLFGVCVYVCVFCPRLWCLISQCNDTKVDKSLWLLSGQILRRYHWNEWQNFSAIFYAPFYFKPAREWKKSGEIKPETATTNQHWTYCIQLAQLCNHFFFSKDRVRWRWFRRIASLQIYQLLCTVDYIKQMPFNLFQFGTINWSRPYFFSFQLIKRCLELCMQMDYCASNWLKYE